MKKPGRTRTAKREAADDLQPERTVHLDPRFTPDGPAKDEQGLPRILGRSQTGRELERLLRASPKGMSCLKMLCGLVREQDDPQHPKVKTAPAPEPH